MYPILVNHHFVAGEDAGDDWHDAEEELHALTRWHALSVAFASYQQNGRGAAVVAWPPQERLSVSFLPEAECAALGPDVSRRVACYDPYAQFVLVFLLANGDTDAYTYTMPSAAARVICASSSDNKSAHRTAIAAAAWGAAGAGAGRHTLN